MLDLWRKRTDCIEPGTEESIARAGEDDKGGKLIKGLEIATKNVSVEVLNYLRPHRRVFLRCNTGLNISLE